MTLIEYLETVRDPRENRGQRYALSQLLFIALLGSLCGYYGYRPLAQFCKKHHQRFLQLLGKPPGTKLMPSYSTFRRIFLQVDAQVWVDAFNVWSVTHAPVFAGHLWSIDGKSIKCTSTGGNTSEQNFAALVSVYGQDAGVVQIALMHNAKQSEIGVAQQLLKAVKKTPNLSQSLDLGFSLDALHTVVPTLELMEAQNQNYIVCLKVNQKNLYRQMEKLRSEGSAISQASRTEKKHGRQVKRTVWVYLAPELPKRWRDCGISRVVWVHRQGFRDGKPFEEMQCYLSNWRLDAETFLGLIQSHWQIENGLHWVKDVTLKEDYPPRRGGFAPISWAVINSFIITLARRLKHRTIPDFIRDVTNDVERIFSWLT